MKQETTPARGLGRAGAANPVGGFPPAGTLGTKAGSMDSTLEHAASSQSSGTYRSFFDFLRACMCQAIRSVRGRMATMESNLVRRDQFNIGPQGIVHKPTDAAFTPNPGDSYSGIERLGQLRNKHPNGSGFITEDVQRMMRELWAEYVAANPRLFKK